jgi:hypothetical protein
VGDGGGTGVPVYPWHPFTLGQQLSNVPPLANTTAVSGYATQLATNGLVLWLDAGNPASYAGTGTVWRDLSGGARNANLNGGVSFNSANGGVLGFGGMGDFCSIDTDVPLGNPCSVFCFFRLTANNPNTIIYCPAANGYDNWFGINGNRVFMYGTQSTDVNNFGLQGTTVLNTTGSVWYSACCVIDGSRATLYLNDQQEATITQPFTIGSWSSIGFIGRRGSVYNASDFQFLGSIGAVLGYNVALTADQVRQNHFALRGRFGV